MYVSSFCGYYSVKTGAFAIGVLSMILSIIAIITVALTTSYALCLMVSPLAHLVCAVLLILGSQERRVEFVFPAVSIFFVSLIVGLPTIFIYSIILTAHNGAQIGLFIATVFVGGLFFAAFGYCFIVIRSFYKDILREKYTVPKVEDCLDVFYTNRQNEHHM